MGPSRAGSRPEGRGDARGKRNGVDEGDAKEVRPFRERGEDGGAPEERAGETALVRERVLSRGCAGRIPGFRAEALRARGRGAAHDRRRGRCRGWARGDPVVAVPGVGDAPIARGAAGRVPPRARLGAHTGRRAVERGVEGAVRGQVG